MFVERWIELNKTEMNKLLNDANEISKIIASIVLKLKDTKANLIKE